MSASNPTAPSGYPGRASSLVVQKLGLDSLLLGEICRVKGARRLDGEALAAAV